MSLGAGGLQEIKGSPISSQALCFVLELPDVSP